MASDFEKRWERIQDQLRLQMNGDVQPRVSSGRTLFGIQSEGERKMDEFARQIEAEQAARRREEERAPGQVPSQAPEQSSGRASGRAPGQTSRQAPGRVANSKDNPGSSGSSD